MIHYPISPYKQVAFKSDYAHHSLPVSKKLAQEVVPIPISPMMTDGDVHVVVAVVTTFKDHEV